MDLTVSNASVAAALRQMAESGRIPHAMLFHQNDGGAAYPLILDFLDAVYGHNPRVKKLIHPDIHFLFNSNCTSNCCTNHGVVTHTDKTHHLNVCRN